MEGVEVKEEQPAPVAVPAAAPEAPPQEVAAEEEAGAGDAAAGDEGEDEDYEDGEDGEQPAGGLQTQRQSTRRKPHVELSRLDVGTLRKYRRTFKLGDPQQPGTKEEHLPLVVRHWQNMTVDEDETLLAFVFALRKQATAGRPGGPKK